jgi:hypothetical protein
MTSTFVIFNKHDRWAYILEMKTSSQIVGHLASMGIQRPSPALLSALEARLAPRIIALIARTLTRRVVAQCFAASLIDAQGSPEGSGEASPVLASSDLIVQQDKPNHVAGTTADAASPVEAA